jgi:transposase
MVVPILRAFYVWLKRTEHTVLPQSKLGEAVRYMLGEYRKLVRYLKYAKVTPDNNIAENCIRPFVIGRKNWLFSDSPRGAHASAVMYSLIETAKANGIEPQEYLYRLFESLPHVKSREKLEALLPWNIKS